MACTSPSGIWRLRERPALGAGSIIAALTSSRIITKLSEHTLALLGLLSGVLGNLLVPGGGLPGALAGFVVFGFFLPWTVISIINLCQRLTPGNLQGRVSAALTFLLFAPQPLAQAAGAAIISQVSYRSVYLGAATACLTTVMWLATRSRRGDIAAPADPDAAAATGLADSS